MRVVGDKDSRGKPRVQTINEEPSETIQSDAHLADIHVIMNNYLQDGIANLDEADLMFKDVSEFTDLADALNQARVAEVEFMKLPSKVREIFDHDVAVWLDTAHDEDKRDALVEAGFIKRVEVAPVGAPPEGTGGPPAEAKKVDGPPPPVKPAEDKNEGSE